MAELLLATTALGAVVAALFAILCFLGVNSGFRDVLTKEAARSETETINRASEEQARGLRRELGDSLANFQQTTLAAFDTLRSSIDGQVRVFGERLDAGVKAIATKLNEDLAQMRSEANANRESLRQAIDRRLLESLEAHAKSATSLRNELGEMSRHLGARVADSLALASEQQKERLGNTTSALTLLADKLEKAQESLRASVEGRLDAIRQDSAAKLEEMRQTVDEKLQSTLESRLGESFNRVVEHLERVHKGIGEMQTLASNVGDLKSVLTNVKVRGAFGEVQLALLLEDLLSPDQFVRDAKVKEESAERVEFAVRMPRKDEDSDVLLPIDAKFPREDYERLQEAADGGDGKLIAYFRKELEKRIRLCAKDICDKYINPPKTTDWAILFLPTEGLYAEVLRQPGLIDSILRDCRVWVAGPTTLGAILNAFRAVYRSIAIEKRSSEVWELLGAIRTEFDRYNKVVSQIERQIGTAANSVTSLHQRTRVMTRKLKSVEVLPDTEAAQKLLGLELAAGMEPDDDEASQKAPSPNNVIPLTS